MAGLVDEAVSAAAVRRGLAHRAGMGSKTTAAAGAWLDLAADHAQAPVLLGDQAAQALELAGAADFRRVAMPNR